MSAVGSRPYGRLAQRLSRSLEISARLNGVLNALIPGTSCATETPTEEHLSDDSLLFAMKDCFSSQGVPTSAGSRILENYTPVYSSTVEKRLLENGGYCIAKTNMDEFSMGFVLSQGYSFSATGLHSVNGPVRNPWSLQRAGRLLPIDSHDWHQAGGSSSGSAVAVASHMADVAIGSDTGGSSRCPAAYCGIVGLKPTNGLVSRHGLIPLVNSLDCPSILARNVDDAACVLVFRSKCNMHDAPRARGGQGAGCAPRTLIGNLFLGQIAGFDELDSTSTRVQNSTWRARLSLASRPTIENLRIGIPKEYFLNCNDASISAAWDAVADAAVREGASVSPCSLPHTRYALETYRVLGQAEVASNMARYDGIRFGHRTSKPVNSTEEMMTATRDEGFNQTVRSRILVGNYYLLKRNVQRFYMQALKVRRLIARDFAAVFDHHDLLLTPTMIHSAPLLHDRRSHVDERFDDYCLQAANLAGVPAITLPVGLSSSHMPIGLQLWAAPYNEALLLNAAKWLENTVQFRHLDIDYLLQMCA